MVSHQMEQVQSMRMHPGLRQMVRMQQANLLQLTDTEFHNLVAEIEQSPFFRRLLQREKLIHYQRFPRSGISASFCQLNEEITAAPGFLDIESLLTNRGNILRRIEELGVEKFKRFFLFAEDGITSEEIAAGCDMEISEVEAVNSVINDFSVMSQFYHPSSSIPTAIHYTRVASIERDREGFTIGYLSPTYARGRYNIDYAGFEQLAVDGRFTPGEGKEARKLFQRLELINARKDTINLILQTIITKQALYLETADPMSLLPFSQKELARKTGLAPSSVSRAIRDKSLLTPWGREVPLKHFLPGPKRFKKELLRQLMQTEEGLTSDEAIRARLAERFGVTLSRRSVAGLRRELKLPARGKCVNRRK